MLSECTYAKEITLKSGKPILLCTHEDNLEDCSKDWTAREVSKGKYHLCCKGCGIIGFICWDKCDEFCRYAVSKGATYICRI